MKVQQFINGIVTYDKEGQYFWIHTPHHGQQMLGELRGWGHIQHMFKLGGGRIDLLSAEAFQDQVGQFVADAINEKIQREKQ